MKKSLAVAILTLSVLSAGGAAPAPEAYKEPLDAATLSTIASQFSEVMTLANRHDLKALHAMFWQSPSGPSGRQERGSIRGELGGLLGQRCGGSEAA